MQAVRELERLGFRFTIAGEKLRYQYAGEGQPDPAKVRPLLEELKANKQEAIAYLWQRNIHRTKPEQKTKIFGRKREEKKPVTLDQVELAKKLLRESGLVPIKSRVLDGEVIYFARDR